MYGTSSGVLQDVASRYLGGDGGMPISFSSYSQTGYTAVKGNSTYTSRLPAEVARPETPPLAFVDRASFPGYRDPDEADEQMYEMSRVRLEPASISSLTKQSSPAFKDDWEEDLAAFMRKYGCEVPGLPEAASAPAPPPAPPSATEADFLDADLDITDMSRKSVTGRASLAAGGMVERPDCGTARASIVAGAYIADAVNSRDDVAVEQAATSAEEDSSSIPQFDDSILDADLNQSEMTRKSLVESANARYSILAQELDRKSCPVADGSSENRPARASVMFGGIDSVEAEEEEKPTSPKSRKILAPQNTMKFTGDAEEEEDDIPMVSSDPSAAFPKPSADDDIPTMDDAIVSQVHAAASQVHGAVVDTAAEMDDLAAALKEELATTKKEADSTAASNRQKRGLKAPSNTKAFTDIPPDEDDDDIPTMDEAVVGGGDLAAALEKAASADAEDEIPRFRQSTLDASLAAHDMQRVSIAGGPARFSVVEAALDVDRDGCPVGRESIESDKAVESAGFKAPANTVVLADEDANALLDALSGADLQGRLEEAAATESGRHPPANTTAVSPKDSETDVLDEVAPELMKANPPPTGTKNSIVDANSIQELGRRLSIAADAVLDPGAPQAQSRDLDLGAVDTTSTSAGLVQKKTDKSWDAGRSPAWPKMQWDLTKEYEGDDKQIEPLGKYSKNDLENAAHSAKQKLEQGGQWLSSYSESGAQKRDFFQDLNRQRNKDKGMQAKGPIWSHLATQAKNVANDFDLQELLITLKLFTSVRFDDYELYMRLLGEIPRYVATATAAQLCSLVCVLARRRIRERNYVDMVASYLLQKLKVTDDHLPPRMLVKAANAFAALECRSNQRFVEHFLRHIEHRIQELDAELCCKVSPLFVISYMNDSLRRAYLKRAAEVQAGFHGSLEECRNLACTEFCLRKEHHSLVSSLPTYVGRYLEKLKQHAAFDRWGTVHILKHHTPNGPKGNIGHDTNGALQQKASTVEGGKKVDVTSSEMHKDVSACLTHLGIEHESGVICGPYLLDCVAIDMVNPSKRIVYEVNAPHHFYEGTNQLIAEKRLRHRMLGRLGQKLHMINCEDWMKLTSAQKMTFMLQQQQSQQDKNEVSVKAPAIAREGQRPQVGTIPRAPAPPPRIQPPRSFPNREVIATR